MGMNSRPQRAASAPRTGRQTLNFDSSCQKLSRAEDRMKLGLVLLICVELCVSHQFYLMPYPVFKERSDSAWEFNDFVTNNGRMKRQHQIEEETPVITIDNVHNFKPNRDIQSFVVGTKYSIGGGGEEQTQNQYAR